MQIQIALASGVLSTVLNTAHNATFRERLERLTMFRRGALLDPAPLRDRERVVNKHKDAGYVPHAGFVVYWKGEWCIDPHLFCVKGNRAFEVTDAYDWSGDIYYFGEPAGDNLEHALTRVMRVA